MNREKWRTAQQLHTPSDTGVLACGSEMDLGAMKKISSMFSTLQEKLHRSKRSASDPSAPPAPRPEPAPDRSHTGQLFFEYLLVVSLRKRKSEEAYEPHITYQFPKREVMGRRQREEEEKCMKAAHLFCFPEGINWAPLTEYSSETFSFVLTEVDGSRRNGYCRRLLPGGSGARVPEAYCIISRVACFGLFSKIFDEVEKRRLISKAMIYPFMQSLREAPLPAPGHTVRISSFIPEAGTEVISLTRPADSWLEHVDFRSLFRFLTDEELLMVFSAAVMERRIIFLSEELSTLSQVLHAVAALLYPFVWQHTFISIVPTVLIDVCAAPTPFLLGVQKNMLDLLTDHSDLMIVDLSAGAQTRFISRIGDEESLLPAKLRAGLLTSLSARTPHATTDELNRLVSEAFLTVFIKTVGHFSEHIKSRRFQKKSFLKAVDHRAHLSFVKPFIQTQMFDLFVQEEEKQPNPNGFFQQKVSEHRERKRRERMKGRWVRGVVV
ncbi:DENN/MADD domain containing 2Db isoform X1 [Pimephales promelas]|uniref:DENN/MADD domain containing 2Db isoform X1 n=1 Tax=Pimephales promelas TaxID=90988 RepID=UPI001955E740|nr:DENN/MADD domain containing 2Db isoform X1 [Pimephales promelas]KAG1946181.1 DENN domain-containing protein 2B [Pimephales promelas]